MKLTVDSKKLLNALQRQVSCVSTNSTLPILETFLFNVNGNELEIIATNLETSIHTKIEIKSNDIGSIAIPSRILIDTLKNIPNQYIVFDINLETFAILLITENGKYRIAGENASDFPKKVDILGNELMQFNISSKLLSSIIQTISNCMSQDYLRPALCGITLNYYNGLIDFVATDAHRLAKYSIKGENINFINKDINSIIIPRKSIAILKNNVNNSDGIINIKANKSNIEFYIEDSDTTIICRLIDSNFPNYNSVIPINNNINISLNRNIFISALKRVGIYSSVETHIVELSINGMEVVLYSSDVDFGYEAVEKIIVLNLDDIKGYKIGFNSKYLLDVLNSIESDEVSIMLSEPNRPCIIVPSDKDNITMLVMPVLI